jgi:polar amino acid transport system permease protein
MSGPEVEIRRRDVTTATNDRPMIERKHEVIEHPADAEAAAEPIRADPVRGVGRTVASILLVLVSGWLAWTLITNPGFQWDVVGDYLFNSDIMHGLLVTIYLVAASMAIAILLGVFLGVIRLSKNRTAYLTSSAYVWFFRGTPVLVQLIFWYNLATLFPRLKLGIPFGGPALASVSSNQVMTPFVAAPLGLSLNEAAYYAEIVRGGILSVDAGQTTAAKALGFTSRQTLTKVVLPQAMRTIVPPTGNQVIAMLKYSALASVIAVEELLHSAQTIYNTNFQTIPLLIVASLWYLLLVTILSLGQRQLERRFSRGDADAPEPGSGRLARGTARLRRGRTEAA